MARPAFKRWLDALSCRSRPSAAPTCCASSVALLLLFWQWRPIGGVVWHVENPVGAALSRTRSSRVGWATVLACTFLINHFDLFGLRQVWLELRGEPYTTAQLRDARACTSVVRHPLYVGWLLAFWATPTMTATHLLFAVVTTAYILIAIQLAGARPHRRRTPSTPRTAGTSACSSRALRAPRARPTPARHHCLIISPRTNPSFPSGARRPHHPLDADAVARPRYKSRRDASTDLQTPALVIDAARARREPRARWRPALPGTRGSGRT